MSSKHDDLALVMSGGGARAAYQVGFLRSLAHHHKDIQFPVITGVSAGAINAAYLANEEAVFHEKVERLAEIWTGLSIDKVYRVDTLSIVKHVLGWGLRLLSGRASGSIKVHGMVDTTPLQQFLESILNSEEGELAGVRRNIDKGLLKALAITASSYSTGRSITWVEGKEVENWERAHRKSISCKMGLSRIMASASLPLFFPSVYVDGSWFGDGGIRLTAPLSPAIHLGGRRLLAISTRHIPDIGEEGMKMIDDYPPPAQVFGSMLNSIFLDVFDNDALRLERINDLIKNVPEDKRGDLHPVKLLLLRPSRDLGKLANDYEAQLPPTFRFMTRGLGTKQTRSNDMLSMLMFQHDYVQRLIELGTEDAEARRDEIDDFLSGDA